MQNSERKKKKDCLVFKTKNGKKSWRVLFVNYLSFIDLSVLLKCSSIQSFTFSISFSFSALSSPLFPSHDSPSLSSSASAKACSVFFCASSANRSFLILSNAFFESAPEERRARGREEGRRGRRRGRVKNIQNKTTTT